MEYDDTADEQELGGADLVKDLRRQLKAAHKQLSEKDTELASLKGDARQRSVAEILTARGVNPKVAKFIPADVEGDALTKWLDEHSDLFGSASAPQAEVDAGEVADTKRLADLSKSATAPSAIADLESRLAQAKSESEVNDLLMEAKSLAQH